MNCLRRNNSVIDRPFSSSITLNVLLYKKDSSVREIRGELDDANTIQAQHLAAHTRYLNTWDKLKQQVCQQKITLDSGRHECG